jgi:hypothetical protein
LTINRPVPPRRSTARERSEPRAGEVPAAARARTVNEKTIADFTRVVEETGILKREALIEERRRKIDAKP